MWIAKPHIGYGMKTRITMTVKIGATMAVAANSPATLKITGERQYWTRLMRPLAPNRNSNGPSMIVQGPANRHPGMCARNKRGFKANEAIESQRSLVQPGPAKPFQIVLAVGVLSHW